ncbi:hypothetical protein CGL56_04900 [Neolewinella marina]|uniref:Uncharacterized protein n=1 Tax=Neolewinella marina TaxID=438751 RepID=A0A2G0CK78_9BACT|nr:hypothetical protein CGL56_04900 [Neolewinella marina]
MSRVYGWILSCGLGFSGCWLAGYWFLVGWFAGWLVAGGWLLVAGLAGWLLGTGWLVSGW